MLTAGARSTSVRSMISWRRRLITSILLGNASCGRVYSGFVSVSLQFERFITEATAAAAAGAGFDTCFIAFRITLEPSEHFLDRTERV